MCLTAGAYTVAMIGLLPDKSRITYDRMFSMLHKYLEDHSLDLDWRDAFFMTDFESAQRESIRLFFPHVRLLGCFFHFSQVK